MNYGPIIFEGRIKSSTYQWYWYTSMCDGTYISLISLMTAQVWPYKALFLC